MRLRVFQASDGDCLLLSSRDGKHMLIDGGRSGSFEKHAAKELSSCEMLEVVCVTHIDEDHISGVIKLLKHVQKWRIYQFEKNNQPSDRSPRKEPASPEPPKIGQIWHNGFEDQLENNAGEIRSILSLVANVQTALPNADEIPRGHYMPDLAAGEKLATKLAYLASPEFLKINVNKHFNGRLVRADKCHKPYCLGTAKVTIIGPTEEDLAVLRKDWLEWVEKSRDTIRSLRGEIEKERERLGLAESDVVLRTMRSISSAAQSFGDRKDMSTPNLASIMFLVEEDGSTALFTGDGACQDVYRGLEKADKLDSNKRIHVNILKIPHHGAVANVNLEFLQNVIADHYVFCGNGTHKNPELSVVQLVVDSRMGQYRSAHPKVGNNFNLYFNSSNSVVSTQLQNKHMEKLVQCAKSLADDSDGQMSVYFLSESFFKIDV